MGFSIHRKINILVSFTLLAGVGGAMFSATDLFSRDLIQHLNKGALDSATLLSARIRSELKQVIVRAKVLAASSLEEFREDADKIRLIESTLTEDPAFFALSLFKLAPDGFARPSWRVVHPDALREKKFTPEDFPSLDGYLDVKASIQGKVGIRLAILRSGTPVMRLSVPLVKERDGSFSQFLVMDLRKEKLDSFFDEITDFKGYLINSSGEVIASSSHAQFELDTSSVSQALSDQRSPARQFEVKNYHGQTQIAAFQRLGFADLAVLTYVPKTVVFSVRDELYLRTLQLGAAFLFTALFFGHLMSAAISRPIRELAGAALRIAGGDLSVRVKAKSSKKDEVAALGQTFNFMAGKINDLLKETAEKARMESELKTAKAVQDAFFPVTGFSNPRLQIVGKSIPASECGGDWWNFRKIGNFLIVAIGDVIGHGVPAALVTGAAYTTFSMKLNKSNEKELRDSVSGWLQDLILEINSSVSLITPRDSAMTLFVSVIDLESLQVVSANVGHRPAYVFRPGITSLDKVLKSVLHLALPNSAPLGGQFKSPIELSHFQLSPGDLILWYTDGLVECTDSTNKPISKRHVLNTLCQLWHTNENVETIQDQLLTDVRQFLGDAESRLDDDITLAIGKVIS